MIIIADSGSTKCSWSMISTSGTILNINTAGINPFFRSTDSIYEELLQDLHPKLVEPVEKIFFYGSGIVNEEKAGIIRDALRPLLPDAEIELHSDVVAACRAIFGRSSGIACILGTGSNVSLYDGKVIVTGVSPLGFILGDEGSGSVFGKKLLGDYFKQVMPLELREKFHLKFNPNRDEVLQRVYRTERPNHFLASFTPFLSENISEGYIYNMVRNSFIEFFERNVTRIPDYKSYPIGFVGSIAYFFGEIVREVCEHYGIKCISIHQGPMDGLVKYHLNNNI